MKNFYICLIVFFIIQLHFNLYNTQIYHGPKLETGAVNRGNTGWNVTKGLARYDWSYCKLMIRDNYTNYQAEVELHPRVDEFTTFQIPYSNVSLMRNPNITIQLQFPGNRSVITYYSYYDTTTNTTETRNTTTYESIILEPKHTYDMNQEAFVNYFTAIVQLDNGNIIDAIWDGDRNAQFCKDCGLCIDQQCAVKAKDMTCDTDSNLCDMKIFVAWAGVDSKGKSCISINKIPSNFRKYSLTPISQFGLGLANDFIYRVNSNTNNPNQA